MAKIFKLALDAGHGIDTPGRRCLKSLDPEEHREWWLNDRVCRYIEQAAKQYQGFETLRVDDVTGQEDVLMSVRCQRANDWGADLYYSAHHNAGINGGRGGGVVAFSLGEGTAAAGWRDALYAAIVGATGLVGNRSNPKTTENLFVLRNTAMPAVLVEHGFMDAPEDVPVILREGFARAAGYAVADCIARRVGLNQINNILEDINMTKDELNALIQAESQKAVADAVGKYYKTLGEITQPSYRPMLDKLVAKGLLKGRGGSGDGLIVDLHESDVRALVILARALEATGLL